MSTSARPVSATSFGYAPSAQGPFDEMVAADGSVRPAWRSILGSLDGLGARELRQRHQKAVRILRDDGATYNVYEDHRSDRTWLLDLIPWVIDSEEWNDIEAGLLERAELFNLVLRDIYGERELIRRGILPPEVVFAHRGFLRACHGIRLPGEHDLIIHSVDMMRRPDGSMCVLADRAQSPSGAGYALENRTVMSRVLPSLFRESQVHRLAGFFQTLRHKLIDLVPEVATPRIVLLTPGSYNETYFEHSYLANYLGFPLVQSGDLVVRGGYVWMKSLDGLKRVDVIVRRVDDYFCDPVELKGDSQLGVPGLLEVVRSGRVAVANPLGSGILETPALLRYLPAISQHFLGRKLRLDSVQTWWCGDADDFAYVREHLDELIVKPVFRAPGKHSVVAAELAADNRRVLLDSLHRYPQHFVAQEKLAPSRMPVFEGEAAAPRPALLRTFAVASEASYRVLPGGLTRVGSHEDASMISSQVGAISKDTWVLATEPEPVALSLASEPREHARVLENTTLPSRVVENLFWMGRYAERAENGLRLMRTVFLQMNAASTLPPEALRVLLQAVTRLTASYPGFVEDPQRLDDPESELLAVITDRRRPGSIASCIQAMLASAEETKELLSADMQRTVNDIRDHMEQLERTLAGALLSAPEEALDPLVSSLLSLAGIVQESMIRGLGWRFIDMGRRLERAIQTTNLARALLVDRIEDTDEAVVLESLLLTIEALISYRRRYRAALNVRDVLELALVDTTNPRSILYQIERLQQHVAELPGSVSRHLEMEGEQRHVLEAVTRIRLAELSALAATDAAGRCRNELDQLFSRVHYLMRETSDQLSRKFFDHAPGGQQLVRQNWGFE